MAMNGTWGDGSVLAAAVRLYKRPITIVPQNGRIFTIDAPNLPESTVSMYLGYIAMKLSAVNNHYVSLTKHSKQIENYVDKTEESNDQQDQQPQPSSTMISASGSSGN